METIKGCTTADHCALRERPARLSLPTESAHGGAKGIKWQRRVPQKIPTGGSTGAVYPTMIALLSVIFSKFNYKL